jgi:hypothetical protein
MCVCVSMCCVVLCVGRGLTSGRSPVQGVLPIVYRFISKNPSTPQGKRGRLRKKKGRKLKTLQLILSITVEAGSHVVCA